MRIPFLDSYIEQRLEKKLAQLPQSVQAVISDSIPRWAGNRALQPSLDYKELIKQYKGEIYSLAHRNAQAVASTPLRLYTNKEVPQQAKYTKSHLIKKRQYLDSKQNLLKWTKAAQISEIEEHPFLDLLDNVNNFLNGFELIEMLDLFLELTGNSYWYIARDESTGVPIEIWPLYSQWVKIKHDKERFIEGYLYGVGPDSQKRLYPPEDVIHFKFANPHSLWYGMGPLQASLLAAGLNVSYDEFNAHMLDNGLVLPYFLSTQQSLSEIQVKQFKSSLESQHRGIKKAGRWGLFHSGIEPKPLATNPKDVDFEAGSEQTLKKMARAFDIPWSVLSTDQVNLANAQAGNRQWKESGIRPRLVRIEQKINEQLMPLYDDSLFVAFDNPVPEDKEFQLKQDDIYLKNKVIVVNEVRERDGLEPVEWGDEPVQAPAPPAPPGAVADNAIPEPIEPKGVIKSRLPDGRERAFQRAIKRWLESTSVHIAEQITEASISSGAVVEKVRWDLVRAEGEQALNAEIPRSLTAGVAKGQKLLGSLATKFDIQNPATIRWAQEYIGDRITLILTETRKAIQDVTAERLRAGTSPKEIAREIRKVKGLGLDAPRQRALAKYAETHDDVQVGKYRQRLFRQRAETIARTESAAAAVHGELESYKEAGVGEVEFSAASDCCDICFEYDGDRYTVGESRGVLPLHPNCRCDWLPVIPD